MINRANDICLWLLSIPLTMLKRWFNDVCEYVDWVMFYVLYEKLRIHVMLESLRKACDDMSCISVKECTQSIIVWEHEHVTKSWILNIWS